jgi:hypothetical protein
MTYTLINDWCNEKVTWIIVILYRGSNYNTKSVHIQCRQFFLISIWNYKSSTSFPNPRRRASRLEFYWGWEWAPDSILTLVFCSLEHSCWGCGSVSIHKRSKTRITKCYNGENLTHLQVQCFSNWFYKSPGLCGSRPQKYQIWLEEQAGMLSEITRCPCFHLSTFIWPI